MKKMKALVVVLPFVAPAYSGELVNGGIHAGSIRDYAPNLSYEYFGMNWASAKGGVGDDKYQSLMNHIKQNVVEKTVKNKCRQYESDNYRVYYGVDNITFSQRQIYAQSYNGTEFGQEVTATFNMFCVK